MRTASSLKAAAAETRVTCLPRLWYAQELKNAWGWDWAVGSLVSALLMIAWEPYVNHLISFFLAWNSVETSCWFTSTCCFFLSRIPNSAVWWLHDSYNGRTLLLFKSKSVGFTTKMACWGDWLGCSLDHGWLRFGKMDFLWGQGQRGLQRPLCSVVFPFHQRLQLTSALTHTQWLSWFGPGREGRTARDQSSGGISGPCMVPSLESEGEKNRGNLVVFHDSLAALSAFSILWIPSKPQLLLHAKGCASPGFASLTVTILVLFLPQILCLGMSSHTGIVS